MGRSGGSVHVYFSSAWNQVKQCGREAKSQNQVKTRARPQNEKPTGRTGVAAVRSRAFGPTWRRTRKRRRQRQHRRAYQGRGQRCEWISGSSGAGDNANNDSVVRGSGGVAERAGVGSMDNTHLWCLPPLIGGPCKSGSKPRQHWTLPPMRDPHSFHPRKAPGAASTQDLPPMRAWTSCASRPLLAPALRPAQAKAAGCPGQ
jgi:hypothetical protein